MKPCVDPFSRVAAGLDMGSQDHLWDLLNEGFPLTAGWRDLPRLGGRLQQGLVHHRPTVWRHANRLSQACRRHCREPRRHHLAALFRLSCLPQLMVDTAYECLGITLARDSTIARQGQLRGTGCGQIVDGPRIGLGSEMRTQIDACGGGVWW